MPIASLLLLHGCGSHNGAGGRLIATGEHFEIVAPEYDQVLRNGPKVDPAQIPAVRRALLDRLIRDKLFAEAAIASRLDRDIDTMQAIEAARRTILANAYANKIAAGAPIPTDREVAAAMARVGQAHLSIQVDGIALPADLPEITAYQAVFNKGGLEGLVALLRRYGIDVRPKRTTLSSANLPARQSAAIARLSVGDGILFRTGELVHMGVVKAVPHAVPPDDPALSVKVRDQLIAQERARILDQEASRLRADRKIKVIYREHS